MLPVIECWVKSLFFWNFQLEFFLPNNRRKYASQKGCRQHWHNDPEQNKHSAKTSDREFVVRFVLVRLCLGCKCWSSMISRCNRIWLLFLIGGLVGNILDFFFPLMSKIGYRGTYHSWWILVTLPLVQSYWIGLNLNWSAFVMTI